MSKKGSSWKQTPKSFKDPQGKKCALEGCDEEQVSQFAPYCCSNHKQVAQEERELQHLSSAQNWNWNAPETVCAYCKGVLGPKDTDYCQKCQSEGKAKRIRR